MATEEKKTKKQLAQELRSETIKTFSMLITSAFGLVAAFAWNDTIKEAIDRFIAPEAGLRSQLIYALVVTLLAVLVSYELGKLSARYKIDDEK